MRKSDYWILSSVVDGLRLLSTLRPDVVTEAFNGSSHGLEAVPLVETLNRLFHEGALFAERILPPSESGNQFVPTHSEIEALLAKDQDVWYGLTARGAKLWEDVSSPDWTRYTIGEVNTDTFHCTTTSINEEALASYLAHAEVISRIEPASLVRKTVKNWEATYWKVFDTAYEAQFQITDSEKDFMIAQPDQGWYHDPFS